MGEHVLSERLGILPGFPTNTLQLVQVIRSGIPASSVDSVCSALRLSQAELASLVDIPLRTLSRRKREGALNSEESAKIIRLARIIERADEVFESRDLAIDWMELFTQPSAPGFSPYRDWQRRTNHHRRPALPLICLIRKCQVTSPCCASNSDLGATEPRSRIPDMSGL